MYVAGCGAVDETATDDCKIGSIYDCEGNCILGLRVGDGVCDREQGANLDCVTHNYDAGDCLADCAGVNGGDAVEDNCGICDNNPDNDCADDCSGVLGGEAVIDDCGVCDGENKDKDCANVCFGDTVEDNCGVCDNDPSNDCANDCAGVLDGDSVKDNCEVCDNDPSNDCVEDCSGEWGGDAKEDNCGVCDNDPMNDCTEDCHGEWGGDAKEDNCGVCDNDPNNDCSYDCNGVLNGDAEKDNCDVCDNNPNNDCVQDCSGTWGGDAVKDNCNVCDNDPNNNCIEDCAGVWGGDSVEDECGVCDSNLSNDCVKDCAGIWGGDSVEDNCGVCDNNSSNDCNFDCAGVWGGNSEEDNCGVCDADPSNNNKTCLTDGSILYFVTGNAPSMGDVSNATGSYFGMEAMGPGQWLYVNIQENDGVSIGLKQTASGTHGGAPNGSETSGIDDPWTFFGNTGMHYTTSPVKILINDNEGNITLDMSGWAVTWNGISEIPMGGCQTGNTANNAGFSGCDTNQDGTDELADSSQAVLTCDSTCADGENYTFEYSAHVPVGDPSNFGGVSYMLHMEGTIFNGTICNGVVDACGVCNGNAPSDSATDNCGVCDANPNNDCVKDCQGIWGGIAVEDNCGVCDSDSNNDCEKDCAGVWGGDAVEDNCGVCDSNSGNDCEKDCAGVWGGNAVEDGCGVCDTNSDNDCKKDCAGVLDGNATEDNCGVCDSNSDNDCEKDCTGVWGGTAVEDGCGVCDTNSNNDCVKDCAGVWGGTAVEDSCGVCDSNLDNDCKKDCAGVWGGSSVIDNCGTCSDSSDSNCIGLQNGNILTISLGTADLGDNSNATGSYFGMEADGPGNWVYANMEGHNGLIIGTVQTATGSHSGNPNDSETPGIDKPWLFFNSTGMHLSTSAINISTNDNQGNITLDMTGWAVTWNGIDAIPMGGCQTGDIANNGGYSGCDQDKDGIDDLVDSGKATLICGDKCEVGDTYTLDYETHVPVGDPSHFGGTKYKLHLEGTVTVD